MKLPIHNAILRDSIGKRVSPQALSIITFANLWQDAIWYQFGHDYIHYDRNSFKEGDAYLEKERQLIFYSLRKNNIVSAQRAFGRLSHTTQDFYAHSNYVELWREQNPNTPAKEIDPLVNDLLNSPRLCSGMLYPPLELLYFVGPLQKLVMPYIPKDSHAWMNKDDGTKPYFDLAYHAAVKRTVVEFELFCDVWRE